MLEHHGTNIEGEAHEGLAIADTHRHAASKQPLPGASPSKMEKAEKGEGALEVGLQAIHHGTPDQALQAAKCLGDTASSSVLGTECLEQDGTLRAILKVLSVIQRFLKCLRLDLSLHFIFHRTPACFFVTPTTIS